MSNKFNRLDRMIKERIASGADQLQTPDVEDVGHSASGFFVRLAARFNTSRAHLLVGSGAAAASHADRSASVARIWNGCAVVRRSSSGFFGRAIGYLRTCINDVLCTYINTAEQVMTTSLYFTTINGAPVQLQNVYYTYRKADLRGAFEKEVAVGNKTVGDYYTFAVGRAADGKLYAADRRIFRKSNPSNHKCGARCRHAKGGDCECACGGQYHGAGG